jgi:glyoxylase-like metal-dependent hydrolase (beta-lactamase superfamily II)
MPLQLDDFKLHAICDGTVALDGGAMFGVVPRPLWERAFVPDDRNRIRLALRCLLIDAGERKVLVDDGIGSRWDGKHRAMYGIDHAATDLDRELEKAGVTREQITDVVLTHLHFDHAGGTVRAVEGEARLSFPNATYHLQRRHWKWAHQPSEKDRGSFRPEDFAALEKSGRLHLLEGATELYDGIHLFISEGHTVGLQLVRVERGGKTVVFCGDLVPTTAHLKAAWVAAYDLYPLTVIEEKKQLLAQAVEEGWILFLEHDPVVAACTVTEREGHAVVDEVLTL